MERNTKYALYSCSNKKKLKNIVTIRLTPEIIENILNVSQNNNNKINSIQIKLPNKSNEKNILKIGNNEYDLLSYAEDKSENRCYQIKYDKNINPTAISPADGCSLFEIGTICGKLIVQRSLNKAEKTRIKTRQIQSVEESKSRKSVLIDPLREKILGKRKKTNIRNLSNSSIFRRSLSYNSRSSAISTTQENRVSSKNMYPNRIFIRFPSALNPKFIKFIQNNLYSTSITSNKIVKHEIIEDKKYDENSGSFLMNLIANETIKSSENDIVAFNTFNSNKNGLTEEEQEKILEDEIMKDLSCSTSSSSSSDDTTSTDLSSDSESENNTILHTNNTSDSSNKIKFKELTTDQSDKSNEKNISTKESIKEIEGETDDEDIDDSFLFEEKLAVNLTDNINDKDKNNKTIDNHDESSSYDHLPVLSNAKNETYNLTVVKTDKNSSTNHIINDKSREIIHSKVQKNVDLECGYKIPLTSGTKEAENNIEIINEKHNIKEYFKNSKKSKKVNILKDNKNIEMSNNIDSQAYININRNRENDTKNKRSSPNGNRSSNREEEEYDSRFFSAEKFNILYIEFMPQEIQEACKKLLISEEIKTPNNDEENEKYKLNYENKKEILTIMKKYYLCQLIEVNRQVHEFQEKNSPKTELGIEGIILLLKKRHKGLNILKTCIQAQESYIGLLEEAINEYENPNLSDTEFYQNLK